jgi:hypothetical protein
VEDDPLNVELFQIAFNNYNCVNPIDVVEDGEQALEYLLLSGRQSPYSSRTAPSIVRFKAAKNQWHGSITDVA